MIRQQIIDLAEEAARWFEQVRRDPDDEDSLFTRRKSGAPEWVADLVKEAHGRDADGSPSFLPDDYRYEWTHDALSAIAEADTTSDPDDLAAEFADNVDVYTGRLLAWQSSNLQRLGYSDAAREEIGGDLDLVQQMSLGQAAERREVFDAVYQQLDQLADDDDPDDDEPTPRAPVDPFLGLPPLHVG